MEPIPRPSTQPEINAFRRSCLIEGTILSLAEHGTAGTSIRTIAAAAGVSHGLARHYFETKDDLMAAAYHHLCDVISESVRTAEETAGSAAIDKLKATPRAVLAPPLFDDARRLAFLEFWPEIRHNPTIAGIHQKLYARYRRRIARLFRQAAAETGAAVNARLAAIGLLALLDGLWLELSLDHNGYSHTDALKLSQTYIDQQLAAGSPA